MVLELIVALAFTSTLEKSYVIDIDNWTIETCECMKLPDFYHYCTPGYSRHFILVDSWQVFDNLPDAVDILKHKKEGMANYLKNREIRIIEEDGRDYEIHPGRI